MKHPFELQAQVREIIELAFKEDAVTRDVTSSLLLDKNEMLTACVIAKEDGVLSGVGFAAQALRRADPSCHIRFYSKDADRVRKGFVVMTVRGRGGKILTAERKSLNFLQHLSGIATLTYKFVQAVKGTRAKIFDTRKTIPGLRTLQKYAVRCGGGQNHRMNLSQMAMIKDNHLKAVEGREERIMSLKKRLPKGVLLVIEAKTMKEVRLALQSKADIIMLDNMGLASLKRAIKFIRKTGPAGLQIEVSGGVNLKTVRPIARLGVDRISVGALTHSAPALDLSMEVISGDLHR